MKAVILLFSMAIIATATILGTKQIILRDGTIAIKAEDGRSVILNKMIDVIGGKAAVEVILMAPDVTKIRKIRIEDLSLEFMNLRRFRGNRLETRNQLNQLEALKQLETVKQLETLNQLEAHRQLEILEKILVPFEGVVDDITFEKILMEVGKAAATREIHPIIFDCFKGLIAKDLWMKLMGEDDVVVRDEKIDDKMIDLAKSLEFQRRSLALRPLEFWGVKDQTKTTTFPFGWRQREDFKWGLSPRMITKPLMDDFETDVPKGLLLRCLMTKSLDPICVKLMEMIR